MAQRYPEDAKLFKAGLDQLGVKHDQREIARVLEISTSHAANMLHGRKFFTVPMQTKLYSLIAAKANGPDEPLGPDDQAMFDPGAHQIIAQQELAKPSRRYEVVQVPDGYAVVEKAIAVFRSISWAEEYADHLNHQSKADKEAG